MGIGELQGEDPLRGQLFRKDQANRSLITSLVAVRGVVHLDNKIRSGGNKFGHTIGPMIGRAAGCIDQKHVAIGPVCVVLLVRIRKS